MITHHVYMALLSLTTLTLAQLATPTSTSPVSTPIPHLSVLKRETSCIENTYQCNQNVFGSSDNPVCCLIGEVCGYDQANSPACCPGGAVCTGLAPSSRSSGSNTLATILENPYFQFPLLSTSYVDTEACLSGLSSCAANFVTCVAELAGVVVTVDGSPITPTLSLGVTATPICSSLSALACFGMSSAQCETTGTAQNGVVIGNDGGKIKPSSISSAAYVSVLYIALALW